MFNQNRRVFKEDIIGGNLEEVREQNKRKSKDS
jgi:hypothetical protein